MDCRLNACFIGCAEKAAGYACPTRCCDPSMMKQALPVAVSAPLRLSLQFSLGPETQGCAASLTLDS